MERCEQQNKQLQTLCAQIERLKAEDVAVRVVYREKTASFRQQRDAALSQIRKALLVFRRKKEKIVKEIEAGA